MRFYDSASATIREFEPVVPGEARIYYCGATVREPHLGHIRSALVFDQAEPLDALPRPEGDDGPQRHR